MNKTNKTLSIAFLLSIALALTAFADEKTITKEFTYRATKGDNESTSRIIAVNLASQSVISATIEALKADQEAAKHVKPAKPAKKKKGKESAKTPAKTPTYEITADTMSIAAGALPVEISDGKWNGSVYSLKATVKTDLKVLAQFLRNLSTDKDERKTLAEYNSKVSAAISELERIGKELEISNEFRVGTEYKHAAKSLEALELFIKGYALGTIGDSEKAVEAFDRSIQLDDKFPAAFTGRGYAYETMGMFKKALVDYDKVAELSPQDPASYNNRGNVRDSLGDHNRAIDDYEKALELDPNNAKAYSNRGTSYSEIGDYHHALEDFSKSIELDPTVPVVYVNRGIVYAKMEDNLKSITDLKTAAKMGLKEAQELLEGQGVKWEE